MRALLWAGLALALMLAGALWWFGGGRASRGAVPEPPPRASAIDESADPALAAPDFVPEPNSPSIDAAAEDSAATAREALDATARPIRGRLIDAHCERPIESGVVLELSSRANGVKERVDPGPGGVFATEHAFPPARVVLRILEARSGEELLRHARVLDPSEPVWTVRAELGLVVPLELSLPTGISGDRAMARVVEYGAEKPNDWIWMPVVGGEHGFVHYFALRQRVGSATARIEVEVEPETGPGARGEAALSMTHGLHALVRVELFEETHAFGRVVDGSGEAVVGARVTLLPTAGATPLTGNALDHRSVLTRKDGAFSFDELEPGPHVLHVSTGMRAPVSRRLVLVQGANDLGSTVIDSADAWTVQGHIVDWTSSADGLVVALVEPASGRHWYTWSTYLDENREREFSFQGVPLGTYEVWPMPAPGVAFEPASATVSPALPAAEFHSIRPAEGKLVLRVLDEPSRTPVERYTVACRGAMGWSGSGVSEGRSLPFVAERYVVRADDHGAQVVASAAFSSVEGGVGVAEALLPRGWSELVVFADADDLPAVGDGRLVPHMAKPVAGARVLADGREVATSDADGLAVVSLAEKPGDLSFELDGRHVLATERDDGLLFVWMIRSE